eukprot:COSAG01_NODE_75735_length_193_cov_37.776596_1_plen_34_part_01
MLDSTKHWTNEHVCYKHDEQVSMQAVEDSIQRSA